MSLRPPLAEEVWSSLPWLELGVGTGVRDGGLWYEPQLRSLEPFLAPRPQPERITCGTGLSSFYRFLHLIRVLANWA